MFDSFDEKILEDEEILKIKKLIDTTNKKMVILFDEKLIEEVNVDPKNMELRFKLAKLFIFK